MAGVGEGDVAGDRCVPLSAVGVKSLDAVLEELAVEPVLKVEPPVVPVGDVEFRVLSVGPNSRSKLSEKSDQLIKYTEVFRSQCVNKQTKKRVFLYQQVFLGF